jgi:isoquinoline 1-oxidoreductase beta subunit
MHHDVADAELTRRRFIKACALAGGGLLLSVTVPKSRRVFGKPSAASASLNAYVRVDSSGRVTVVMPKVEMGQGTYTSLPMLVAEELEVGVDSIDIEPAPPDPAV